MKTFVRFPELQARGYFSDWHAARRAVANQGFPTPYRLSPQVVAWAQDEIDDYDAKRQRRGYPLEVPPPRHTKPASKKASPELEDAIPT